MATTAATQILHRRYIGDDPKRKASVEAERVNVEIARMIYNARKNAGLTQAQLAKVYGTTQSVISRIENGDYEGHSLTTLQRIAEALGLTLRVSMDKEN
jgi:ribosome-binding protein aMBF1 (putative translation factor)